MIEAAEGQFHSIGNSKFIEYPEQVVPSRAVLDRRMTSLAKPSGSQLPSDIIGLAVNLAMPAALKFTGMFWDVHGRYHILERLVEGIGSSSGHYSLGKK